jgi:hypothetical protein
MFFNCDLVKLLKVKLVVPILNISSIAGPDSLALLWK